MRRFYSLGSSCLCDLHYQIWFIITTFHMLWGHVLYRHFLMRLILTDYSDCIWNLPQIQPLHLEMPSFPWDGMLRIELRYMLPFCWLWLWLRFEKCVHHQQATAELQPATFPTINPPFSCMSVQDLRNLSFSHELGPSNFESQILQLLDVGSRHSETACSITFWSLACTIRATRAKNRILSYYTC